MKQGIRELQKLRGVGEVLARRFIASGYDTFAKVAAAGEEGLKKISGINPRMIESMLNQANELTEESALGRTRKAAELRQRAVFMKEKVQRIALNMRDRFKEEVVGKRGKRLERELLKMIDSLEKVEINLETRLKKAGKRLAKAEKRLESIADTELKGFSKKLKKARKSLKKVVSQ